MNKTYFSASGYYRIEVQGHLSPNWSDRFGAMRLFSPSPQMGNPVAILRGRVSDQAELAGILNSLYDLHLPLLLVQYLGLELPAEITPDE